MKTLLRKSQEFSPYIKREYSLFQTKPIVGSYLQVVSEMTGRQTILRCEGEQGWGAFFLIQEDMERVLHQFVAEIEKESSFLEKEFKELDSTGNAMVETAKAAADRCKDRNADLRKLLLQFYDSWVLHLPVLWKTFVIPEAGNIVFTRLLERHVSKELWSEAIARYSRPNKKAHLLRLAEQLAKERDTTSRSAYVKTHYPWIFTTDIFSPPTSDEQYKNYAEGFSPTPHPVFKGKELFPKEAMGCVRLCQEVLYLKDHRDEYRRQAFFYIQPLVEAILKRCVVSRDDLWYLMPEELDRLHTDRESALRDIAERKVAYVYERLGSKSFFLQGAEAKKNFVISDESHKGDVIKGVIGAPGNVRGTVQVIRSGESAKDFKEGNVLVATTTNPDYIAAMQRAVAFVTNEGGITCHAAIVARELHKPCIVGTKVATKVLKDGDVVEVDAERGVVTIIKKANQ